MIKLILKSFIFSAAFFAMPFFVLAAPSVTSLNGIIDDGQGLTIAGSGFGVSGPALAIYDNFEESTFTCPTNSTNNAATIGQWDACDQYSSMLDSNAHKISGNNALEILNIGGSAGPRINLNSTNRDTFYSFWAYVPADKWWPGANSDTDWLPANWKIAWLKHNNDSNSSGADIVAPLFLGHTGPPAYLTAAISTNNPPVGWSSVSFSNPDNRPKVSRGEWFRLSVWVSARTDGTGQVHLWELTPAQGLRQRVNLNNANTIKNDVNGPYYYNTFVLNGYARPGPNNAVYFDDVYVAQGSDARARVEIGDASNYANSKNLSILTINSWSDTSITATFRQGSFANGTSAYLYVFDGLGNVNANGYPVTIGGDSSDVISPSAPQSLQVF